ncbi:MAG: HAD-IA family hydrolase [Bacteroidales bacterium]|jgi:HAD superfamily hydrolase (TIGR01549 family)|nr:HAD-IA family hydrolase [Bacteroidales bacterium]MDD2617631.1 HAD-IA family hydrolase [Bacteroidales bacterium]MDD4641154.1 HAD-IA family hydrolase [Bacteroidales bacterium]NLB02035.1 HAD-IA family hydrolase [Bacteroidales bacterium]
MTKPRYVIFDFDGTLVNTTDLALSIYNRVAANYRCKPIPPEDKHLLFSSKLKELMDRFKVNSFKLFLLQFRIRKELRKHIEDFEPIAHIETALAQLKEAGYKCGILTSNAKKNVEHFLDIKGLSPLFDFVYQSKHFFGKDLALHQLIKRESLSLEQVVYVGDEIRDMLASKKAGIPMVAVSWGFTPPDIFEGKHPDRLAYTPAELKTCIDELFQFR